MSIFYELLLRYVGSRGVGHTRLLGSIVEAESKATVVVSDMGVVKEFRDNGFKGRIVSLKNLDSLTGVREPMFMDNSAVIALCQEGGALAEEKAQIEQRIKTLKQVGTGLSEENDRLSRKVLTLEEQVQRMSLALLSRENEIKQLREKDGSN